MKLSNIASLDPAITSTGRIGLMGASVNDRSMWHEMQNDWEQFSVEAHQAMTDVGDVAESNDNTEIKEPTNRPGEEQVVHTNVRIGQRFFREAVLSAYNHRCCITGLAEPRLLIASHIVPWRIDRVNRTNPQNGLLLSALHDKAFDAGLITVREDMTLQVSRKYPAKSDIFFAASIESYDGCPISRPEKFGPDPDFLAYHRRYVFQS